MRVFQKIGETKNIDQVKKRIRSFIKKWLVNEFMGLWENNIQGDGKHFKSNILVIRMLFLTDIEIKYYTCFYYCKKLWSLYQLFEPILIKLKEEILNKAMTVNIICSIIKSYEINGFKVSKKL